MKVKILSKTFYLLLAPEFGVKCHVLWMFCRIWWRMWDTHYSQHFLNCFQGLKPTNPTLTCFSEFLKLLLLPAVSIWAVWELNMCVCSLLRVVGSVVWLWASPLSPSAPQRDAPLDAPNVSAWLALWMTWRWERICAHTHCLRWPKSVSNNSMSCTLYILTWHFNLFCHITVATGNWQ